MDFRQFATVKSLDPEVKTPPFAAAGVCFIWVVLLCCALLILANYQLRVGAAASTPASLKHPGLSLENQELLLVSIHPHCPCTRATVTQLERTLASSTHLNLKLKALVYAPSPQPPRWLNSDTIQHLSRIGFEIFPDSEGNIGRKLGAETSGHVFFYDAKGRIQFSGGITAGRGHAGPNAAERALHLRLTGAKKEDAFLERVYGCSLIGPKPGGDQ